MNSRPGTSRRTLSPPTAASSREGASGTRGAGPGQLEPGRIDRRLQLIGHVLVPVRLDDGLKIGATTSRNRITSESTAAYG